MWFLIEDVENRYSWKYICGQDHPGKLKDMTNITFKVGGIYDNKGDAERARYTLEREAPMWFLYEDTDDGSTYKGNLYVTDSKGHDFFGECKFKVNGIYDSQSQATNARTKEEASRENSN